MATTTPNYGWAVPTSTDLVKDGAVAIETLGDSIDATTKALNPSTTLGDIEYRSSTANTNTRLGIGSAGQVLTVASGVPSWATPPAGGGGKILQVVTANYSTTFTTSSSTPADTGLTASITPSATTSKILVIATATVGKSNANSGTYAEINLVRGSTTISTSLGIPYTGTSNYNNVGWSVNFVDSPNTISSTTYKIQVGATASAINFGANSSTSTITLLEIGA